MFRQMRPDGPSLAAWKQLFAVICGKYRQFHHHALKPAINCKISAVDATPEGHVIHFNAHWQALTGPQVGVGAPKLCEAVQMHTTLAGTVFRTHLLLTQESVHS